MALTALDPNTALIIETDSGDDVIALLERDA